MRTPLTFAAAITTAAALALTGCGSSTDDATTTPPATTPLAATATSAPEPTPPTIADGRAAYLALADRSNEQLNPVNERLQTAGAAGDTPGLVDGFHRLAGLMDAGADDLAALDLPPAAADAQAHLVVNSREMAGAARAMAGATATGNDLQAATARYKQAVDDRAKAITAIRKALGITK